MEPKKEDNKTGEDNRGTEMPHQRLQGGNSQENILSQRKGARGGHISSAFAEEA